MYQKSLRKKITFFTVIQPYWKYSTLAPLRRHVLTPRLDFLYVYLTRSRFLASATWSRENTKDFNDLRFFFPPFSISFIFKVEIISRDCIVVVFLEMSTKDEAYPWNLACGNLLEQGALYYVFLRYFKNFILIFPRSLFNNEDHRRWNSSFIFYFLQNNFKIYSVTLFYFVFKLNVNSYVSFKGTLLSLFFFFFWKFHIFIISQDLTFCSRF